MATPEEREVALRELARRVQPTMRLGCDALEQMRGILASGRPFQCPQPLWEFGFAGQAPLSEWLDAYADATRK